MICILKLTDLLNRAVGTSENPGVPVVIKDLLETKITKVFSVFCYIKFEFALHMVFTSTWDLKPSNNFTQILLMRRINQAFMMEPKIWVWLITLKKQANIQNIFSKSERKQSKNYLLKRYGHSKWSPHNLELAFGPIQISLLTKCLQKHCFSSPFLYAIFEKFDFDFSWQIQV